MTLTQQLRQKLYFACSKKVTATGYGIDKDEAWRIMRSTALRAVTECTRPSPIEDYELATDKELMLAIKYINTGELPEKQFPKVEYASPQQRAKLHSLALECALHYVDWSKANVCDTITGEILTEDTLRLLAERLWNEKKLTGTISKFMYTSWINPKIHEMLVDKGLRKATKSTYYIDYHKLTHEEAMHLIKRFNRMLMELLERNKKEASPYGDLPYRQFSTN